MNSKSTPPDDPLAPSSRCRRLNPGVDTKQGLYVAYWMVRSRRTFWNPALERAAAWARLLGQSLLVCEPLDWSRQLDSRRSHRFFLDGMVSNARRLSYAGVLYHPHVAAVETNRFAGDDMAGASDPMETTRPAASSNRATDSDGLLEAVARRASVWVTDLYPAADTGDLSHLTRGRALAIPAEAVDGERLDPDLPTLLDSTDPALNFDGTAEARLRERMVELLRALPSRNPLAKFYETHLQAVLPHITNRWPAADGMLLAGDLEALASLPVGAPEPFPSARGGSDAGFEHWRRIIGALTGADSDGTLKETAAPSDAFGVDAEADETFFQSLPLPALLHTAPEAPSATELLGYYLSAGHLSGYQVLVEALRHSAWTPDRLRPGAGSPLEWWGLPTSVARLVETFVVQRERALDRDLRRAEAALEASS